mgnify:CR=1 FL=1
MNRNIFGIDGKKALEKLMKEPENQEKPAAKEPVKAAIKDDYIYLPDVKLYVAKQRSLLGYNWQQAREELAKNNEKMLSPLEFATFLQALSSGNREMQSLYEDITAVRNSWRTEWLDAKFSKSGILNKHSITYHKFSQAGSIEEVTEQLDSNTLMKDKQISLDDWLANPTKQGLPRKDVKKGSLYYWFPRNNYVARFGADAGRADLYCIRDPWDSYSALGVRRAKFKA